MISRRAPISRRTPLRPSQQLIQRKAANRGKRTPARRKKRQSLSKQADALWSKLVKLPGHCELCGRTYGLQAAHGFSRRYRGTRWLPINGFCLCSQCHVYYTWRDLEWQDRLRMKWGSPVYDELRALALKKATPDFPAIIAVLTAEIKARS